MYTDSNDLFRLNQSIYIFHNNLLVVMNYCISGPGPAPGPSCANPGFHQCGGNDGYHGLTCCPFYQVDSVYIYFLSG